MGVTSIFFLLPFIGLLEATNCPPYEDMRPCACFEGYFTKIVCIKILRAEELISPIKAVERYKTEVLELIITDSSLLYFPDNLFQNTLIHTVEISDSNIMSLSESDTAFNGLEDILRVLRVKNLNSFPVWDFEQLRNIKNLRAIEFSETHVGSVVHSLPMFPKLFTLELNSAEISYINDHAFINLPKLKMFELRDNAITEMKRSMLPNPANNLSIMDLSGNQISYLSKDFFENMPSLKNVFLSKNKFRTLPENPFSEALRKTEYLTLKDNPIHCDCRLHWLVNKRYHALFRAECSTPKSLAEKSLTLLDYKSLWCL